MIKGNAIVGQSGGPTAVINSSLAGVYKTAIDSGCKKVYGMRYGIQGLLNGEYIDMSEHLKSGLEIELLKRTPASFLGTCRYKLPTYDENPTIYEKVFGILNKLDVKYFFYIGGNDSMDTIMKLSSYGEAIGTDIRFIGVPKTIDNDLVVTDHTPGYGSAAKYIATSFKEIICDARNYYNDSITIVEIMGRNAGWLTGSSVLSRCEGCPGPDLIYLPERVFDYNDFLSQVEEIKKSKKVVTVAVSEGVKTADGRYICEANKSSTISDAFGHKLLGGTAMYLSDFITQNTGVKSRGIVFSTLQRCASHMVSRRDITEAYMVGTSAVNEAMAGKTAQMIIIKRLADEPYSVITEGYDIFKIANKEKYVPDDWITDDGVHIKKEFEDYVKPLIIGELSPFVVDGLPRHLFINE